ncbi:MAG: hypothetical protein FWD11_08370 [Micrococcales bacterium]|nr:hypothetical protein [Micrococcales bacterium]
MATSYPYEFVFPQRLVKDVLPRPGGVEVPQPPFPKNAADRWRAFLDEARPRVTELLAASATDPEIAAAARDESSAAWAGLALHMAELDSWVDCAVAAGGPVFAAETMIWFSSTGYLVENLKWNDGSWETTSIVTGGRVYWRDYAGPGAEPKDGRRLIGFVPDPSGCEDDLGSRWAAERLFEPCRQLRIRLAATGWDGIDALEPLAARGASARLVMSILAPQRRDWYAAAPPLSEGLLLSVATLDELMAFTDLSTWADVWPTLLDGVGVDLAEYVAAVVESTSDSKMHWLIDYLPLSVVAEIPVHAAFRVLLQAADLNREAATAVVGYALRWPRVAAPVLAASAATNPRSKTLLGMLSLDDLAEHRDDFSEAEWAAVEAHAKATDGPVAEASAVPALLAALPWDDRPTLPVLKLKAPSTDAQSCATCTPSKAEPLR